MYEYVLQYYTTRNEEKWVGEKKEYIYNPVPIHPISPLVPFPPTVPLSPIHCGP